MWPTTGFNLSLTWPICLSWSANCLSWFANLSACAFKPLSCPSKRWPCWSNWALWSFKSLSCPLRRSSCSVSLPVNLSVACPNLSFKASTAFWRVLVTTLLDANSTSFTTSSKTLVTCWVLVRRLACMKASTWKVVLVKSMASKKSWSNPMVTLVMTVSALPVSPTAVLTSLDTLRSIVWVVYLVKSELAFNTP